MTSRADQPGPARRRSRFWPVAGSLLAVDVVGFVLAAHALATYHARPHKPTVMPMATLLTFLLCTILLALLVLISLARFRGEREWATRGR